MQPHPFTFLYAVTAAISLGVARTMWHRASPGARTCATLMVAIAIWSAAYACELASTTQAAQLAWAPVEYLGILFAPVAWFVFALRFTGRDGWLNRGTLTALGVVPVVLYALLLTDRWHHLIYENVETVRDGPWLVLKLTYGPAGWANVVYAYTFLTAGAGVILSAFFASPRIYRKQITALLLSAMAPWLVNVLYQFGIGPAVDMTPFGFTLTGLGCAWAIRNAQLLDLAPVARGLVVESLGDGVAVLDQQDRLIDANAALRVAVGPVTIGDSVTSVFSATPALLAQLRGGPTAESITSATDPGREYEPAITPLVDRRGREMGRVVTLRDITDRRRVMAELAKARDAAEDLAKAKSEFLATVSHEIRTPMNGVIGVTALLLGTTLDQQQRAYVETIRSSGGQLLSIINDILDFSKFDAGQLSLERVPFAPRDAVAAVIAMLRPEAESKGLALVFSCGAGVPAWCAGDEFRVRQIATNLVGNAIKFTDAGSVTVTLEVDQNSAATTDASSQRLRLTVRDTGIGIPAERMDRLFRPFSQVDASVARRHGGSGLGLAISRGLAEMMGGTITVDSVEGAGTTFIAVWTVEVLPGEPAVAVVSETTSTDVPVRPMRILVAEDNRVNQLVVVHMLRRLGYSADVAEDGVAAVTAAARSTYDIVLMDVQMPNMDGLTATRTIREAPGPQPRIIAMTANAMPGDRELCLEAGMDDYMSKPIDLESLGAALARSLPVRPS